MISSHKIAEEIKKQVDRLVDNHGSEIIDTLREIRNIPNWTMLETENSRTILLAIKMYLDGVIRTLYREKQK